MKKILIIASSTGSTAPGKVFSKYISLLKNIDSVQVDIISNDSALGATYIKLKKIHPRIKKMSVSFLGYDIFDYFHAKKISSNFNTKYDIVISMMSANHFFPLYLGYFYKSYFKNVLWINYSVDAIPAPEGWGLSKGYSDGLIRMINKFMVKVDHLYFSNKVMLNYQLGLLGDEFKGRSGVLYTIPSGGFIRLPYKENNKPFTLLYTGGIYQARKVDQLLIAFERLVLEGNDLQLNFIGTNPNAVDLSVIGLEASSRVKFFGYTTDLLPFYQEADLLIDIDADIANDVFISSKFFNYLMVNRYILCITGKNSPVKQLVDGEEIKGVYFSEHSFEKVFQQLKNIILSDQRAALERNIVLYNEGSIKDVIDFESYYE